MAAATMSRRFAPQDAIEGGPANVPPKLAHSVLEGCQLVPVQVM